MQKKKKEIIGAFWGRAGIDPVLPVELDSEAHVMPSGERQLLAPPLLKVGFIVRSQQLKIQAILPVVRSSKERLTQRSSGKAHFMSLLCLGHLPLPSEKLTSPMAAMLLSWI